MHAFNNVVGLVATCGGRSPLENFVRLKEGKIEKEGR